MLVPVNSVSGKADEMQLGSDSVASYPGEVPVFLVAFSVMLQNWNQIKPRHGVTESERPYLWSGLDANLWQKILRKFVDKVLA